MLPTDLTQLDSQAFGALLEPHRHELHVHCYRMLGSLQDAEDMVQETFLRAWRRRETYAGRASLRAWLYKIATNACLDWLNGRPRRAIPLTYQGESSLDAPIPPDVLDPIWLDPFPDALFAHPEGEVLVRENIRLAFITALHLLPPRQRAVLILCDVLDWKAEETATFLDTTISAVKSALHRARTRLADYQGVDEYDENPPPPSLLEAYMQAWEMADVGAFTRLLREDAIFSMPPIPAWYRGRETIQRLVAKTVFAGEARGRWAMRPTQANQQPAFGLYRGGVFYGIQVLTLHHQQVRDVITFRNPALYRAFGLPEHLGK